MTSYSIINVSDSSENEWFSELIQDIHQGSESHEQLKLQQIPDVVPGHGDSPPKVSNISILTNTSNPVEIRNRNVLILQQALKTLMSKKLEPLIIEIQHEWSYILSNFPIGTNGNVDITSLNAVQNSIINEKFTHIKNLEQLYNQRYQQLCIIQSRLNSFQYGEPTVTNTFEGQLINPSLSMTMLNNNFTTPFTLPSNINPPIYSPKFFYPSFPLFIQPQPQVHNQPYGDLDKILASASISTAITTNSKHEGFPVTRNTSSDTKEELHKPSKFTKHNKIFPSATSEVGDKGSKTTNLRRFYTWTKLLTLLTLAILIIVGATVYVLLSVVIPAIETLEIKQVIVTATFNTTGQVITSENVTLLRCQLANITTTVEVSGILLSSWTYDNGNNLYLDDNDPLNIGSCSLARRRLTIDDEYSDTGCNDNNSNRKSTYNYDPRKLSIIPLNIISLDFAIRIPTSSTINASVIVDHIFESKGKLLLPVTSVKQFNAFQISSTPSHTVSLSTTPSLTSTDTGIYSGTSTGSGKATATSSSISTNTATISNSNTGTTTATSSSISTNTATSSSTSTNTATISNSNTGTTTATSSSTVTITNSPTSTCTSSSKSSIGITQYVDLEACVHNSDGSLISTQTYTFNNGIFELQDGTNRCLMVSSCSASPGTRIVIAPCIFGSRGINNTGMDSTTDCNYELHRWYWTGPNGIPPYALKTNLGGGLCIDVYGAVMPDIIDLWTCDYPPGAYKNLEWMWDEKNGGIYSLDTYPDVAGKCLTPIST